MLILVTDRILGASFWGTTADLIGRSESPTFQEPCPRPRPLTDPHGPLPCFRVSSNAPTEPAFNATILIGGIFACAVAGSQNFLTFCALWAVIGTAAGGNVPVDSIIFLEFMPQTSQWLLTTLSAWWNLGQVIVSLVAWVFLANYSCDAAQAPCASKDNMGW